eukprot:s46_g40.t6
MPSTHKSLPVSVWITSAAHPQPQGLHQLRRCTKEGRAHSRGTRSLPSTSAGQTNQMRDEALGRATTLALVGSPTHKRKA